jgi:hypothetical protein
LPFLLEVIDGIVFVNAVRLQESVHLQTFQAQHAAEFRLRDPSGPQFFEREGL